ncbi:MAG: hypothetical protein V3T72_18200 [Thermoanaerobaculia bacterium]
MNKNISAIAQTDEPTLQKPLRLWPGVVAVVLQWLVKLGVPIVVSGDSTLFGTFSALFGGLAVVVWWAFFSRAPRSERWGAVGLMIVVLVAAPRLVHESIRAGAMGFQFFIYALPVLSLAFVAWAVASRRLADRPRRAAMVATILLACGVWTLVRSDGVTGDGAAQFAWRWAETAEERLLAQAGDDPAALPSAPTATEAGSGEPDTERIATERIATERVATDRVATDRVATDWPGFRGPARDGVIPDVRIETDWSVATRSASPPVELWRRPIEPGWSSVAVRPSSMAARRLEALPPTPRRNWRLSSAFMRPIRPPICRKTSLALSRADAPGRPVRNKTARSSAFDRDSGPLRRSRWRGCSSSDTRRP